MKLETVNGLDAELPASIKNLRLWVHQKVAFLIIISMKRFMLHLDMGAGKTITALAIIKYRKELGEQPRAIIFVPFITAIETWIEETAKHTPELTCVPLLGTIEQNRQALRAAGDLFVACYPTAVALVTGREKAPTGKTKWVLKASEVRQYFAGFDMVVFDEIQKCSNVTSLTYRMCRAISDQCTWAIGLTGTPFGKDLQDLWPQFYLIDFGEALGPTFGFYREAFFTKVQKYWGGFEYKFQKKLFGNLKRMIKHSSISYGIDEFADMPPKKYITKNLMLPVGIKAYADKAIEQLNAAITSKEIKGNRYEIVNSSYLQLRQLASGFMTFKGEDSSKVQIQFDENPKLEALTELLEAMPHDSKMIVFHHFVYTNKMVSDHLKGLKIGHARVWGGSKDPIAELRKFKTDPDCKVLVINSRAGSASLNLQIANFVVFFEQPESAIDRQQAERRTWRPGQEKRVFYYDLIISGTADGRILAANKAGEDLLKQLLERGLK